MESLGVHQSNQSGCQRTEFGVTLPAIATCRVSLRIGVLQRYQGQPFGLRPTGLRLLVQIGLQICSSGRLWPFKGMSIVPGLRSPYAKVDRLVYFGRMLDKIRLHGAGKLPADEYVANLGKGFDKRCCGFLRISYDELKARVVAGTGSDPSLLAWAEDLGGRRSDEDCELWNSFMMKRGFRDEASSTLAKRIQESGFEGEPIMTMFDYIDFDEGRDPVSARSWEG